MKKNKNVNLTENKKEDALPVTDSAEATAIQAIKDPNVYGAHAKYIADQGQKIILATASTSLLYHELICYIRRNSVPPKLVSEEMQRLGFVKARASEVNRIANAADEVFSAYESKMIGFKAAIAMARQDPGTLDMVATPAADLLLTTGKLEASDVEAAMEPENEDPSSSKTPSSPKAKNQTQKTNSY